MAGLPLWYTRSAARQHPQGLAEETYVELKLDEVPGSKVKIIRIQGRLDSYTNETFEEALRGLFEGVELTARYFYDALDMSYEGGIFFRSIDEKGGILKQPDALIHALDLGRRIVTGLE